MSTSSEEPNCEGHCPYGALDIVGSPLKLWDEQPLRQYRNCVQIYNGRKLPYIMGKMIAFDGLVIFGPQNSEGRYFTAFQPYILTFPCHWAMCHSQNTHSFSLVLLGYYVSSLPTARFIAISEAKNIELEEFDSWACCIPQEWEEAEWCIHYACMIQWNDQRTIAERVGLAKTFKDAFHP